MEWINLTQTYQLRSRKIATGKIITWDITKILITPINIRVLSRNGETQSFNHGVDQLSFANDLQIELEQQAFAYKMLGKFL